MPSGLGCASGALVAPKSGTSYPTHLPRGTALPVLGSGGFRNVGSHQIQRLRSLQGLPFRSAEARLYMTRRFGGPAPPPFKGAPGTPGGAGPRPARGVRAPGGGRPPEGPGAAVGGPRPAPLQVRARHAGRVGLAPRREVLVPGRVAAAVDPRRAGRRPVVFQLGEPFEMLLRIGRLIAVDLPQHFTRADLARIQRLLPRIGVEVPRDVVPPLVARELGAGAAPAVSLLR